ncbi:hypothetical protein [Metapseudomonas otitidis]|uniref:hypothetical protein n=1 Tax=Metapseudomonas otitidis TaxID=319939 RepID=UPI001F2E7C0D|nr:hypothetical protein [Pseudomonas otitidis]MEE1896669.1 hypothetical protein [Pseudomonas otitidis]
MKNYFFGFPGAIDLLIIFFLIKLITGNSNYFSILPLIAIPRILVAHSLTGGNISHRGLSFDLILALLSILYLLLWGNVDAPSITLAYMGVASGAEIFYVLLRDRKRIFK